jgi:hypothetical protein
MTPWVAIWIRPRQTIRRIVDTNPKQGVLWLAMASATAGVLIQFGALIAGYLMRTRAAVTGEADSWLVPLLLTLLGAVIIGALGGLGWLYLFGWLYRWVGSWFGGQAKNVEVRAAIAWVEVVSLAVFGVWVLLLVVSGGQLVSAPEELLTAAGLGLGLVAFGGWMWRTVLVCHTLGEVHRFSAWKGLGTLLIPHALLVVPVFMLALLAAITIPNVLRGRMTANESMAIGNLRALVSSLEMHRSVTASYPDDWRADMYRDAAPDYGPPGFDAELQTAARAHTVQGYAYRYTPLPPDCAGVACEGYTLSAVPAVPSQTGTRSFIVDDSGRIRHCTGATGAQATDQPLDQAPTPCQSAPPGAR